MVNTQLKSFLRSTSCRCELHLVVLHGVRLCDICVCLGKCSSPFECSDDPDMFVFSGLFDGLVHVQTARSISTTSTRACLQITNTGAFPCTGLSDPTDYVLVLSPTTLLWYVVQIRRFIPNCNPSSAGIQPMHSSPLADLHHRCAQLHHTHLYHRHVGDVAESAVEFLCAVFFSLTTNDRWIDDGVASCVQTDSRTNTSVISISTASRARCRSHTALRRTRTRKRKNTRRRMRPRPAHRRRG